MLNSKKRNGRIVIEVFFSSSSCHRTVSTLNNLRQCEKIKEKKTNEKKEKNIYNKCERKTLIKIQQ